MFHEKHNWCRDDWFAREDEAACGFQYKNSQKIFDSQVSNFKTVYSHLDSFYNNNNNRGFVVIAIKMVRSMTEENPKVA